jgi:hypothetical protein
MLVGGCDMVERTINQMLDRPRPEFYLLFCNLGKSSHLTEAYLIYSNGNQRADGELFKL